MKKLSTHNNSPKIAVLILSAPGVPWALIEEFGQRRTFAVKNTRNTSFYWYRGYRETLLRDPLYIIGKLLNSWYSLILKFNVNNQKGPGRFPGSKWVSSYLTANGFRRYSDIGSKANGANISLPIPELRSLIGLKTLLSFKFLLENDDFDFLVRTNSSSYLDIPLLESASLNWPRSQFFAGVQGDFYGEQFTSGAAYILSRDLVILIVENSNFIGATMSLMMSLSQG